MQAISMDQVRLSGAIKIKQVLDFTITARANEHGIMHFKAIVDARYAMEDLLGKLMGKQMCLTCSDKPYFAGEIIRAKVQNEGSYLTIETTCISGSYLFDMQKNSRSFQNTAMTYAELLKKVQTDSAIGSILPIAGREMPIGYPIIQYEETDWAFTKRMASHFGTVVLPEIVHGHPQISMGVVYGETYTIEENAEYEIGKMVDVWTLKQNHHDCQPMNFIYYKVKDYRNFELGDKVTFKDYPLTVMAKKLSIKDGLLEGEYELGYEQGYGLIRNYNTPISGKSIQGTVIATAGEKLKIHLDIDEAQDEEKAYWYTWMPRTGNLMYCMPKLKTKVHLHFPNQDEKNAIANECVRTNGGAIREGAKDYQYRHFFTEHDKGVVLAPNYMNFMGDSLQNRNKLSLDDARGIAAETMQDISIHSTGRLSITADGLVEITAGTLLTLDKTGEKSGLELSGSEINKYAEKIIHNGLSQQEKTQANLNPPQKEFPAGVFSGTVLAMVPAVPDPKNAMPEILSVLAMTNIAISNLGK